MTLIALQPTADPLRFQLRVTPQICVGHPDSLFMFGGAGLATGLAAIETATGRPTVWAAAQYLSYARPDALLDIEVLVPVSGKYTSQGRVIILDPRCPKRLSHAPFAITTRAEDTRLRQSISRIVDEARFRRPCDDDDG